MDDDDRISSVFRDAVATLDPPVERLVAGAIARGRRRLRLIRGVEALSVVAVLVAAGALVVALIPAGAGRRHVAVLPGRVVVSTTAASQPAVPDTVTITPQALLQTALDTLPRHGTTSGYAGNFDGNGFVGTQFVYDDGAGAAQVLVALQYPQQHPTPHPPEPVTGCRGTVADCTVLPDGAHALTREGLEYPYQHDPNATERSVDLVRDDGVKVSVSEWNAPQEKDAATTRDEPPFTLAELTTWADDPAFSVQITQHRADAASDLFRPVDLSAPDHDQPLTPKQRHRVERRNCRSARLTHKTPPSYCPGG